MRKMVLYSICLLVSLVASAQTQQGYVKTKGRLGTNGTVIAGTRLPGATVIVRGGNAVVSGNNGKFSLSIPENNYYLQNVQKLGYVLTDPDVLSKQYAYSKNPLVLVLETPNQQTDDKIAVERQIRRTLQRQLQDKEDEIESLKEQQKLNEEECRKQLQELYSQQESNEKLIGEMADRYSKIDFDEVDEFNRCISQLILEGKLTEADSLLNTKGDINSRAITLRQHQEANAQEEQEIKRKQKKLVKSKAMTQKELEDLAGDCYLKFELFKMQHQNDSAAYYIELRAGLDSTKMEWLFDVALYLEKNLADYNRAIVVYEKCLDTIIKTEGKKSSNIAILYNRIGRVYREMADYEKALSFIFKAIELEKELFGPTDLTVVKSLITLGIIYSDLQKYEEADTCYLNALANKSCELSDSICLFGNLGANFIKRDMYQRALESYEKALELLKKTQDKECLLYEPYCYNGLSRIYQESDEFDMAIEYIQKSIDADRGLYGDIHPQVAADYNNIGSLYNQLGRYNQALENLAKAASNDSIIYGTWHPALAHDYNNIGYAYQSLGQYDLALFYYQKALDINKNFYGQNNSSTATNLTNIGNTYGVMKNYPEALEYTKKALEIFKSLYGDDHSTVSTCYNNIGDLYIETGEFDKAEESLKKALEIDITLYGDNHSQVATLYNSFGRLYNATGNYVQSALYMEKTIPILTKAYGEEHPNIAISNYNIGVLYKKNDDYEKALEYTEKAYQMMSKFLPADHPTLQQFKNGLEEIKSKLNTKNL